MDALKGWLSQRRGDTEGGGGEMVAGGGGGVAEVPVEVRVAMPSVSAQVRVAVVVCVRVLWMRVAQVTELGGSGDGGEGTSVGDGGSGTGGGGEGAGVNADGVGGDEGVSDGGNVDFKCDTIRSDDQKRVHSAWASGFSRWIRLLASEFLNRDIFEKELSAAQHFRGETFAFQHKVSILLIH